MMAYHVLPDVAVAVAMPAAASKNPAAASSPATTVRVFAAGAWHDTPLYDRLNLGAATVN